MIIHTVPGITSNIYIRLLPRSMNLELYDYDCSLDIVSQADVCCHVYCHVYARRVCTSCMHVMYARM